MSPTLREYLLKGLFLGLWVYLAISQDPNGLDERYAKVMGCTLAGLALGIVAGTLVQLRRGYKPLANLKAFPLVVLLESPYWIYAGVIGGLGLGVTLFYDPPPDTYRIIYFVLGGMILGYGFNELRQMKGVANRLFTALIVGALLVYLADEMLNRLPGFNTDSGRAVIGYVIFCGLPFFWLLTFCGTTEESELEIAALCAGIGVGMYESLFASQSMMNAKMVFIVPVVLYLFYALRWMPTFKVFKHTLRGYTAMNLNRPIAALQSFKRALTLQPRDTRASGGMWDLHQKIEVETLPPDSPVLDHLDYNFCLNQVQSYLIGDRSPTAEERLKADRMLNLVERQRPKLSARVDYLRAVSLTHAKNFDDAAALLSKLLNPETPYESSVRNRVLFSAWELATRLHPALIERLGEAELAKPGRRMQAIAAVERALTEDRKNPVALEMKMVIYSGLQEDEFTADAASGLPEHFNYEYAEQLGLALTENPEKLHRGMGFLRIAGRGNVERGASIFAKLAELETDAAKSLEYSEFAKRCGQQVGVKSLAKDQHGPYFASLKKLADAAEAKCDYEAAIAEHRSILESGENDLECYRKLADLYEKQKDPMNALLMAETGLVYSKSDKDMLARKDRYYYSVEIDRLKAVKDKVYKFFDVDYCAAKAKQILDAKDVELESIDWALHLAQLGRVLKPDAANLRLAEARARLRKGERDAALTLLEDIREKKESSDEWFVANKMLGELYLNEYNRPDLAVNCYIDYRDYSKSGADTLFQIAKCYEGMNQPGNAIKFYEAVTAYDSHPKYWEAKEALGRLKVAN